MCIYVHVSTGAHRGQKNCIPLDLELQAIVNFVVWVLGVELKSSGRAVDALKCWAINFSSTLYLGL